jgi:UDP-N-acetylmuramoyl-tripeptide--D-alanyl-D-alanine ligase
MTIQEFYNVFIDNNQRFTTDTRAIRKGDIFFALKGERFNGNTYAAQALEDGASYVVVDEEIEADSKRVISVTDVLSFMQELATYHRDQFDIPVLAIAGSNGKTTTKELLMSTLSTTFKVHATQGNFNNHIGVPLTLLSMPKDTEVALVEIGTNGFGEIEFLCSLLKPNYGLITNIGKEHLEGFGDLEGVAREESTLFLYLMQHGGYAFVNADDPYLSRMSHRLRLKTTYSAVSDSADVSIDVKTIAPKLELDFRTITITSVLSGMHNAQNIVCTLAVARNLGVELVDIKKGIESYNPSNNRSQVKRIGSNSFLLDAYNANPSSMEAAIETFEAIDNAKKCIVLGDMFELGKDAQQEHLLIGKKALDTDYDVILCGSMFAKCFPDKAPFTTVDDVIEYLKNQRYTDTWFLVKGSRGMKMERILEAFE